MNISSEPEVVLRKRRRIWLVLTALLVVLASVTAVAFVWWHRDGRFEAARQAWQPASDHLSALMRDQPVAGWRASPTDLGLPAPVDGDQSSRLAVSNETYGPRPFIGSVGDNAYFLATSGTTLTPEWWLVGIDVKDGQRLFPAVPLSTGTRFPQCFVNGPTDVLCLSTELISATAWVVDAKSGATIYNGPTDLRVLPAPLVVEQVGSYAVAKAARQGVYGIGHHAETTWFVPGDGTIQTGPPNDVTPALATQESADGDDWNTTVFDVSNGSVVQPEGPEGAKLQKTVLYPGGFAAVVEVDDELTGVQFFNEAGKHLASADGSPSTDQTGLLPNVAESPTADVSIFSPGGGILLEIPRGVEYVVGQMMYLNENASDDFPMWRQYDLKTGNKGPACDFNMRHFLGTDGSVFVFEVTNRSAGMVAKARDRNTCEELWTLPSAVDSLGRIWRVNTTLVQLSDDGTELTSLVAPS